MKKIYQVIMQDENNVLDCIGFYNNLDNALPEVNNWLSVYNTEIDSIYEYSSAFNMCFDRVIEVEDGESYVYLRGFIFDIEELQNTINKD